MDINNIKPHFKKPQQVRSKMTVEAILQASAIILNSDGIENFNTNRIAIIAGVSVASIYQYFPNKESIFQTLVDDYYRDKYEVLYATIGQGLIQKRSINDTIEETVEALFNYDLKLPKLNYILLKQAQRLGMQNIIENHKQNFLNKVIHFVEQNRTDIDQSKLKKKLFILICAIKGVNKAFYESEVFDIELLNDVKCEVSLLIRSYLEEKTIRLK